jgi:hypothetical protein
MKTIITALSFVCIATFAQAQSFCTGYAECTDINADGVVTVSDGIIALHHAVEIPTGEYCVELNADPQGDVLYADCGDYNGDGVTTATDALLLTQYAIELPVSEPACLGVCNQDGNANN